MESSATLHHLSLVHMYIETATLEELLQLREHLDEWIKRLESQKSHRQLDG